jgi:hypothetical protein
MNAAIDAAAGLADWPARLAAYDWDALGAALDRDGHARLPGLFAASEAAALAARLDAANLPMRPLAAIDRGDGEYRALPMPLAEPWASLRAALYARLAPIADRWNAALAEAMRYPADFAGWAEIAGPVPARCLKLGAGDFEALHQDVGTAGVFPLQAIVLLSEPQRDFRGGELTTVEQRPRMQSRPAVVPLRQGDAAVLAVQHRPYAGTRGLYRVELRHGVSRVREGVRIAVDLPFHGLD